MKKISKLCEFCNQPFDALLKEVSRGGGRFCSRQCAGSAIASRLNKKKQEPNCKCSYCKTPFYRSSSKLAKSKSGLHFCSRTCKDTAQRTEGLSNIHPSHYSGKYVSRSLALRFYGAACLRCGYQKIPEILEVHHKNRDRSDNRPENLEVLCPTCHCEQHFLAGTGKWKTRSPL